MSDTSTTETLNLTPETLTLVRVTPEYLNTGEAYANVFTRAASMPEGEERDNLLTFYAVPSRDMRDGWATLVVPLAEDRGWDWWRAYGTHYESAGLVGDHKGWNIQRQYLSLVVPEGPSEPSEGLPETFTREDVDRLVREARAAKDEEFQQWKERANEVAIEYAIENDLCGEFERCMEEIGFRGRNEDYTVTFTVTVSARNDDGARDEAIERVYNMTYSDLRCAIDSVEEY